MKKRILSFVLGISMMAALTGCGKSELSNDMVTIKQYKGLEVSAVEAAEVTEKEIDESIAYTLEVTAGEYGIKDRAAVDGDTVIIDYVGKLDGVAFDGGTAEGAALTLGSDSYIDGFEDAIIGHTPGETFDINVTFPEDYGNEELNGQPVVFTITFQAIVPTEITDEIASNLVGEATTAEEYREIVKNDLEVSNEETALAEYENAVYGEFVENCTMEEYPEDELEEWVGIMEETYSMYASYYGMTADEFLEEYYGVDCETLAKEQICFQYAVELVAEEEGLTLSLEEFEEVAKEEAANYGFDSVEEYQESYEDMYGEGSLEKYLLQEKVMDWLVENSKTVK